MNRNRVKIPWIPLENEPTSLIGWAKRSSFKGVNVSNTIYYEFDRASDLNSNGPVNIWVNNMDDENDFSLHQDSEWDKV